MNINNFKINKKDNIFKQTSSLEEYISKKINSSNFSKLATIISKSFDIPEADIKFELKKILSQNHDFQKGYFDKKFNFFYVFISILEYLFTLVILIFFSKKNNNDVEKVEIIFDEILSQKEYERVLPILNKFKSYKIISSLNL